MESSLDLPVPTVGSELVGMANPNTSPANSSSASPTKSRRLWLILLGLTMLLFVALAGNLALGSTYIPPGEVLGILLGRASAEPSWQTIIWQFRWPRALTAALAGAALAIGGLQMQTLFRNPLAGPFVLGIDAGASLGVALVLLVGGAAGTVLGDLGTAIAASLGAATVLGLVALAARYVTSTAVLLILGLMFGNATLSVASILLQFSSAEQAQSYLLWTFGSFSNTTSEQLPLFSGAIASALVLAFLGAKPLNALLLGETYARSLGLDLGRARWQILASTALLAGTVTAFCGPVAFLGVAVPHLCRGCLKIADHRYLLPGTALIGATLALCANLAAQLPGSQFSLPLNAVLALIGAPVVAWVVLQRPTSKL